MNKKFFFAVLLIVLSLILIEISLRMFIVYGYNVGLVSYSVFASVMNSLKGYGTNILGEHNKLLYKYLPNVSFKIIKTKDHEYKIKTTDIGFGNIGFVDDGISGDVFAVAVGDSFTACIGVDYNFCWVELLEKYLGCDIVNMGVEGYSSAQKIMLVEDYALKLKPKVILLDINLTDPSDDFFFANKMKRPIPHPINRFYEKGIQYYSASYLALRFLWDNLNGYTYERKFKDYVSKYKDGVSYTIASLEKAIDVCNRAGVRLILVLFHSIKPIVEFAYSREMKMINLQNYFESRKFENIYLPNDGHLNINGNIAAFEIIKDFIVQNELEKLCLRKRLNEN
ncbi:MAG: SGNH/GDSL hydrolase family protein [bacterium]|nr:SGNH/GDSL hydrolase family protein [bacterium]